MGPEAPEGSCPGRAERSRLRHADAVPERGGAMRFRTFILVLFWFVVGGYAAYAAALAGSSYFETRGIVEQAFAEASSRQARSGAAPESAGPEYATEVRSAILLGAQRASITIDPRNLNVVPERASIRVTLHWSHPVLMYGGESVVAIPLWIDQSFDIRTAGKGAR